MGFVFYFVYVVCLASGFANSLPAWRPWAESHLVMVNNFFNVALDPICDHFVKDFGVYVHQDY